MSVWRCFRVCTGGSPLSLLYNVISHRLSEEKLENFAIMKKYFVVLLLSVATGAFQNVDSMPTTSSPQSGVIVSGNVRLCDYERGCLITDNDMKHWTQKLEISYDGYDKTYGIYVKVQGDIINLSVKYSEGDHGSYIYKGYDRMTNRNVTIVTKQKLSSYLNNNGVSLPEDVQSEKGIIVAIPSTYTVFSIVPIKNK